MAGYGMMENSANQVRVSGMHTDAQKVTHSSLVLGECPLCSFEIKILKLSNLTLKLSWLLC